MEEIKNWLNSGGTYSEGVAIFCRHSTDKKLIQLFTTEMVTEFKKQKLKTAMKDLFRSLPAARVDQKPVQQPVSAEKQGKMISPGAGQPVASPKVTKMSQKTPGRWSHPDDQDTVEKSLFDIWQPLFLEKTNLQSRILDIAKQGTKDPAKKDEAGQMAHRILNLARQIRKIYTQRDEYFATGSVPVDEKPSARQYAIDPVIAHKEWKNAERYVRTMKNKLKKNPADQSAIELLAYHQAAVDHYKEFFKTK
jgi:hypothetical protein